jgi:opacity protein-like surface antigen
MRLNRWGKAAVILLILAVAVPAPTPALAGAPAVGATAAQAVGFTAIAATFAYFAWLNRPAAQSTVDWSVKGPGGFFIGGFTGAGFVQPSTWSFPFTDTSRVRYAPSLIGGLKGGYFLHSLPYFGGEIEFMYDRHDTETKQVNLSPAVNGATVGSFPKYHIHCTTLAFHFLGRYGFLKDKEVPFGRLQPYVGIGPGFVILWATNDSAKNFSLEALAGVRYLLRKNLSVFLEYKFSQQWDVELDPATLVVGNELRGKGTFDFTVHRFAVGLAFHFL